MNARLGLILVSGLLFTLLIPSSLGQVQPEIEQELVRIGFKQGAESIPLDGSTIPVGPGDEIWLLAFRDVEVTHGVVGGESQTLEISNTESRMIQIPGPDCCDRSLTYVISAVSTSPLPGGREAQTAVLRVVGPHEPLRVNPSTTLSLNTIQIRPTESDGLDLTTQLALLRRGVQKSSLEADFGIINYTSVMVPGGQVLLTYQVTELGPIGGVLHIVLESPRVITAGSATDEISITLRKNGTVVSTVLSVDNLNLESQMNLPNLNEPGNGGDTPIQLGLHYLHIFSEGGASGDINIYLPVFVLESASFTLLDHSTSPMKALRIILTESDLDDLVLVAVRSTFGVTTLVSTTELDLPLTRLRLFNGPEQLFSYELGFSGSVQQSQHEGITYLLGNSLGDSLQLTRILVNNFTVRNFEILGKTSNEIGFPEDLEIVTRLNTLEVSVVDEVNRDLREGSISVEKSGEAYKYPLAERHALRLESGTYTITYSINDDEFVRETLSVNSNREVILSAATIGTIDLVLTVTILGEIGLVAFLGIRAVTGRMKEEESALTHVS